VYLLVRITFDSYGSEFPMTVKVCVVKFKFISTLTDETAEFDVIAVLYVSSCS
jgi:hypothetical protein